MLGLRGSRTCVRNGRSFENKFLRTQSVSTSKWCVLPSALRVQIVETSLDLGVDSKLARHLGLRFGSDTSDLVVENGDFSEAHFGPGSGGFQEGFLNIGKGMVADSEYKNIEEAGSTERSLEECLDWCRKWSEGKLYVTVGQNCWTMCSNFLDEDEGTFVPESVKFREQQVNKWTKLFVDAAQKKADDEGVEVGQVWERIMDNPNELFPQITSLIVPSAIQDLFPGDVDDVQDAAEEVRTAITESVSGDDENAIDDLAGEVKKRIDVAASAMFKKEE